MSHRMYLYNLSGNEVTAKSSATTMPLASYGVNDTDVRMMMEWKYEFPLLFHPLFDDTTAIAPPVYNGSEGGLYAPAAPGIEALKALYDFIEKHQDTLIDDIAAFQETKTKIFTWFSRKVIHPAFHLDAWDVFNMSDESHETQAEELIALIHANNKALAAAIAADNPALLDSCPYFQEQGNYFKTFRQLLNEPLYQFGWSILASGMSGDEDELQVFSEGNLKGLKDTDGNEVVAAIYEEIYGFPYGADLAVVMKNGKAGYIDKSGREVMPCVFDDAYDFEDGYAAVVAHGKFGLIDTEGNFKLPAIYEDGHVLSATAIAVQQDGLWGIIDIDGQVLLPFRDVKEIIAEQTYTFTYYKLVGHQQEESWYTHAFKPLVIGPVSGIECFGEYYIVTKDGRATLIDAQGNVLLGEGYLHIRAEELLNALIVQSAAGTGLYIPEKGWILPCVYEAIFPLEDANPEEDGTVYVIVKKNKEAGLFGVGANSRWIKAPGYQQFRWLKKDFLSYQENKLWGCMDATGRLLTEAIYTAINSKFGYLPYGLALGFHSKGIDVIDEDGSTRLFQSVEAQNELNDYPQACYSKTEIQQLKQVAKSAEKALTFFEEAQEYKEQGQYEKALDLFRQSAELGNPAALTSIGHTYEVAYDDFDKAFAYYSQAAQLGEVYAMSNLGLSYQYGRGTAVDIPAAIDWFQKAADRKHGDAYLYLGDIYYHSTFNVVDYDKALFNYSKAHLLQEQPVADAIGHIYEVKQNYEQAVYYYGVAVENGNAFAKWRLACLYMDGNGVDTDLEKALLLLHEAVAEQAEAHLDLVAIYMSADYYDEDKAGAHLAAAEEAEVPDVATYKARYEILWKRRR
ncbi:SEL1-like repeat protein [Chitinophaga pinensis]|uniref:Sel1 domain protein repeat-containing protein n=1 Tax=Chitinophaga pinensis (strain ATCC 43595 / DSM 2588 / LMG 13176 / NBRC 15968 / NCIMB 11800 / UQM 2034) TaxID=485918 RepID=A0A979GWU9_CHIPD|nr:SEL1-like repeat protein [Chitinophaga pinensis]ACU60725.1 Sel1 domain protein repeat-containing protein [Chitinophaga pinensis DSM 2588]